MYGLGRDLLSAGLGCRLHGDGSLTRTRLAKLFQRFPVWIGLLLFTVFFRCAAQCSHPPFLERLLVRISGHLDPQRNLSDRQRGGAAIVVNMLRLSAAGFICPPS
mgnify:CR=1 FL=1